MEKLLLLEDNVDIREMMETLLGIWNYTVVTVKSTDDICAAVYEHAPKGIILDITIHNIHHLDLCQQIKSNERIKHIPILLTSAMNLKPADVLRSQCDRYLEKPFDLHTFKSCVAELLKHPAMELNDERAPEVCGGN